MTHDIYDSVHGSKGAMRNHRGRYHGLLVNRVFVAVWVKRGSRGQASGSGVYKIAQYR
jgi:hypothetical protein